MSDERHKLEINWVQASAGALAAVSSAVLLSTVGVAGTIVGAALGSVAATVGSAVYSHYLQVSRERVSAVAAARSRVRRTRAGVEEVSVEEPPARVTWHEAVSGLPWRRLFLAAGAVFLAAMVAIVSFELLAGRSVASFTGGSGSNGPRTSVPGLGGSRHATAPPSPTPTTASPSPSPTASTSGTTLPAPAATPSAPGTGTTPSPSAASPSPSAVPTPSPSGSPRGVATAGPSPVG